MLRSIARQIPWNTTKPISQIVSTTIPSTTAATTTTTRALSSGKAKARGKRLRGGGGIPGPRYGGKISTELTHRGESILESVRAPKSVVNPIARWRILRGDFVQVTSGPESGKRGRVLEAIRASNCVLVEGVAMVTKMVPQVGTDRKKPVPTEGPIYVSRVNVICPETNLPTRIRYAFLEDGTKVRVAVRSGAVIPRPEILKQRRSPKPNDTVRCTPPTVVLERTYKDEDGLYDQLEGFESVVQVITTPSSFSSENSPQSS